ncbi:GTPase family protein [Thermogutta sp.]|uniref:GTPase family protein n=1 Tax=Thermogutta sp. TaxID=1962930 RepID=UPI003C7ABD18
MMIFPRAAEINNPKFSRTLEELKARLPRPVIWLVGKAQAGKTSIIHALTGDSRAEIGNGFEPCTKSSWRYPFPNHELPLLEFLDTRGLDDPDYDPAVDMQWHEEQAHLVMAVMRAMDPAQEVVRSVIQQLTVRHPEWPIIVVQTCLHEGYPWREPRHILPYPFDRAPLPPEVPQDLARALTLQRSWFQGRNVRFVAIDFTLPEDGFTPQFYGLEQLWQAIEDAFPLSLRGLIAATQELRHHAGAIHAQKAQDVIFHHTLLAAAAGAVPVPAIDLPLILGIQFLMAQRLAAIYNQPLTWERFWDMVATLGWGFFTRWGVRYVTRELLKVLPWLGLPVAAAFSGASTYALGHTLAWYFAEIKDGALPTAEDIKHVYQNELIFAREHAARLFQSIKGT